MSDLSYWLQLLQLPISRSQKHALIERYGSVCAVFQTDAAWQQLSDYCSARERPLQPRSFYQSESDALYERMLACGWQLVTPDMERFPARLRSISDPPLLLFYCGDLQAVTEPQLAIVGSRKATPLGIKLAMRFAKHLSDWGVGVVSGLALGVDTAAHKGALQGDTPTSAVLANGPGAIYPPANRQLADQIVDHGGVLLSENPPGAALHGWRFPERNRLISGLTLATLVVEADLKSGSLVTAKLALSQGAEVFAVPGAITNPQARGCHQLIKQGALLVESPDDILNALHQPLRDLCSKASDSTPRLTGEEPLVNLLQSTDMSLDELASASGLDIAELQAQLARLELSGAITRQAGRYFYSS